MDARVWTLDDVVGGGCGWKIDKGAYKGQGFPSSCKNRATVNDVPNNQVSQSKMLGNRVFVREPICANNTNGSQLTLINEER